MESTNFGGSDKNIKIHNSNLGNRRHIEDAQHNSALGLSAGVIQTVAEIAVHTGSISEDLLYADSLKKTFGLIAGGYIKLVNSPDKILSEANIKPHHRFRLTAKGEELLQRSVQAPFQSVAEVTRQVHEADLRLELIHQIETQLEQHISPAAVELERQKLQGDYNNAMEIEKTETDQNRTDLERAALERLLKGGTTPPTVSV
ncbi:MAG: hypothetical protein WCK98_02600 [bacterium]